MTKISEIVATLKAEYPTIKVGCDEDGYTELIGADYDAKINEWANNLLAKEIEIAETKSKVEQAATDKVVLLARLGITADEMKILLG